MSRFFKDVAKKAKWLMESSRNAGLNRKMVGMDRNGNRYYQYYSDRGDEDKREVEVFSASDTNKEYDPYWDEWLRYKQKVPYSPEELAKFYAAEDKRVETAFAYEKKDAEMMKQFRKEFKKQNESGATSIEKGFGQSYEPGMWKPGSKRDK